MAYKFFRLALSGIAAVALLLLVVSSASASVLGDALTFNSLSDELSDESRGLFIDVGTDSAGTVGVGDWIQGVIRLDSVTQDVDSLANEVDANDVYAAYSFQVIAIDTIDGETIIRFGAPVSSTSIYSMKSLLEGAGFDTTTLTGLSGTLDDATFAVFEIDDAGTSIQDFNALLDAPGDTNPLLVGEPGTPAIGDVISADNGWILDLVAGLVDADDYYDVKLDDLTYDSLAVINSLTNGTAIGDYSGAFSIIMHGFSPSQEFLDLTNTGFAGNSPGDVTDGVGHIITSGNNTISAVTSVIKTDKGWAFRDDGLFQVNPAVPEPASMLVWAGLLGIGGLVAARRRKAAKA